MIREGKEARLVLALAAGANATVAARKAGCSRRTVFRRLKDPEFVRAVGRARGQILSRATSRLARTSTQAVDTLQKLLDDGSAAVRRMAAKSLLDSLARLSDLTEIEERIAELETALGEEVKS
jgi:phage terminase small subunit